MATVGDMITNVSLELKDTGNNAISVPTVVTALNRALTFYKRKPFYFNEFQETITIAADSSSFTLSTNTPLYIFEDGGVAIEENDKRYEVNKITSENFDALNDEGTGRPFVWTYRNQAFDIYYYTDQAYTAHVRGVVDVSAISTGATSSSTATNVFTNDAPTLIEYNALKRIHAGHLQDEKMGKIYGELEQQELDNLMEFDREKNGTGEIRVHSILL